MTRRNSKRNVKKDSSYTSEAKPVRAAPFTVKYDYQGKITATKQDICDCFDADCPGCHFPCERCDSQKCGIRCRVNRPWPYDSISFDGKADVIKNPLIKSKPKSSWKPLQ